jgi:hypothetical protein
VKLVVPKVHVEIFGLDAPLGMKNNSTPVPAVHPVTVPLLGAALKLLEVKSYLGGSC